MAEMKGKEEVSFFFQLFNLKNSIGVGKMLLLLNLEVHKGKNLKFLVVKSQLG